MNDSSSSHGIFSSLIQNVWRFVKGYSNRKYDVYHQFFRRSPFKATVTTALIGFVLRRIPIFFLLNRLTALMLSLAKPLIFLFGVIKLMEKASCCGGEKSKTKVVSSDKSKKQDTLPVQPGIQP